MKKMEKTELVGSFPVHGIKGIIISLLKQKLNMFWAFILFSSSLYRLLK